MKRYDPKAIEPKWQKKWEEQGIYHATEDPTKPKKYVLEFFPYPSGAAMHVGHVRNYTIGDTLARFNRMQGYNVLHPMGWDAFGLPAENFAIKTGTSPRIAVRENTKKFKRQLMQMGFSYDWTREINSTDPEYYRWTQWFFLLLFKRGLAYQKESLQWWCPVDKTVLANEQVENGRCWRCDSVVEKKPLKQWFFKITQYADRLLEDLDELNWTDAIKSMQRNWIGKSKGAEIDFKVDGLSESITVFTTRPDTLFGATFMVLAPEHPLVQAITSDKQKAVVEKYVKDTQAKSDIERQETEREKTGVFTGAYAINPVNNKKIPIWIADYVLASYGTGAIMAVPAHDQRDYEFAQKFDLPIVNVINPVIVQEGAKDKTTDVKAKSIVAVVVNDSEELLTINLGKHGGRIFITGTYNGDKSPEAVALREVAQQTGYTNLTVDKVSDETFYYKYFVFSKNETHEIETKFVKLKLISSKKQKTQQDVLKNNKCTVEWVFRDQAEKEITDPVHRFGFDKFIAGTCYHGEGVMVNSGNYNGMSSSEMREKIVADLVKKQQAKEKINYKIRDWLISRQRYWGAPIPIVHCAKCKAVPVPEDQLPVKLPELKKFEPSGDGRSPLANVKDFVNTTCPKCHGSAERETDTMDGFACSSWYFLRFADPHNNKEPFSKKQAEFWLPVDDYIGGAEHAVMHLLYARFWTKVMYDEGLISFTEPFKTLHNQGMILAPDGQKMSKSKGNTIEPDGLISQGYGADAIRIMELFIGPYNQSAAWSVEGMGGSFRFLQRVWTITQEFIASDKLVEKTTQNKRLMVATHQAIKKVTDDLRDLSFNTAIAALMEYVNELYKIKAEQGFAPQVEWKFALHVLLRLLAPFAPHISEELWHDMRQEGSIHTSDWPKYDPELLVNDSITIVVQVNGKVRANVEVPADSSKDDIVKAAQQDSNVQTHLSGKVIKKIIYVAHKLVNFVV